MTLEALHPQLAAHGLAMSIVGSISDSTIAGVISTGTHGSGLHHGCIATYVLSLDILLANGSRIQCSKSDNPELFIASLCGLGTTGLILRVTLQVEKAFRLKEVRSSGHIDDVIEDIDRIAASGEFVRLWWSPQTSRVSVMQANRTLEVSFSILSTLFSMHYRSHIY
jgi:FAD/FMN-containing dehydrogenase